MKKILNTLGIIFFVVVSINATDNLFVSDSKYLQTQWTTQNGLPQNSVQEIIQTKDEYIWLATLGGLARFDGVKFTVFNPSNTPELKSNRFVSLYEDFQGILWITSDNGEVYFYHNRKFELLEITDHSAKHYFLKRESNGDIWIVLNRFIVKRFKFVGDRLISNSIDYVVINNILAIHSTTIRIIGSKLWYVHIGTRLVSVDIETKARKVFEPKIFLDEKIRYFYNNGIDKEIWVITRKSVGKLVDGNFVKLLSGNFTFSIFAFDNNQDFWCVQQNRAIKIAESEIQEIELQKMNGSRMQSLHFDSQGVIWVGTKIDGLFGLKKNQMRVYGTLFKNNLAATFSVLEDQKGKIWIGTLGLISFADNKLRFENRLSHLHSPANYISTIGSDKDGNVWYANRKNLIKIDKDTGKETVLDFGQAVYLMYFDQNDGMWLGSKNGVYLLKDSKRRHFSENNGLVSNWIQYITQVKSGDVWIGTRGGLSLFKDGSFTNFTTANGLSNNNIRDIYEDRDGTIWIGTYGGGIIRYKDGQFVSITKTEGLPEDIASSILLDDNDRFWVLGNMGVYSASRQAFNDIADGKTDRIVCSVFDEKDGMYVSEGNGINQYSSWKGKDGTLWFAMIKGVLAINPNVISNKVPSVYIEQVSVAREIQDLSKRIDIPNGKRDIAIEYTGIDLLKPENVQFRYKLEGSGEVSGKDWHYVGKRRTVYFSFLPAGDYIFTIEATSSASVWGRESAKISLRVLSPFWKTWWFLAVILLLTVALVFLSHRLYLRRLHNRQLRQQRFSERLIDAHENERKRIASDLHDSLGQNLLVIKAWTGIALEQLGEKSKTGAILKQVNEIASISIEDTRNIVVNLLPVHLKRLGLTKTIKSMVKQLNISSAIHFECDIDDIDGALDKKQGLSIYRVIQESLNNVIKHSRATVASVTIKEKRGYIFIEIEDNGKGFDVQEDVDLEMGSGGVGVNNMIERVNLIEGKIEIDSNKNAGTSIKIRLVSQRRKSNNEKYNSRFSG